MATTIYKIQAPATLRAKVKLPASKSISNRAILMSALACRNGGGKGDLGKTAGLLENLSDCDDTAVMLRAFASLEERGARKEERGRRSEEIVIDIGAAGTAMRFLTAFLAVSEGVFVLTGTERMKQRPIGVLVDALRQLGAAIDYLGETGFPPLRIVGKSLDGGLVEIVGSVSSQYVSALLMIAPTLRNGLEIKMIGDVVSRPYIDLTLWMMREFGADADWTSSNTISVKSGAYRQRSYRVENDWTAASYWYEMVALTADENAEIRLSGLSEGSKQGDAVVRDIFAMLGVGTEFVSRKEEGGTRNEEGETRSEEGGTKNGVFDVILRKNNRISPRFDYDFVNSPDLVQTVAVTCAAKGIPFHFRGLQSLKIKETDRLAALVSELRKLGFAIRIGNGSELVWDGERCEPTFEPIDTYDDHRMALSFAPLALVFPDLKIRNPQVVTKSYPNFWEELLRAKFIVHSS
ncbi:MAG: 3-phosphoshikimate 1-carboxyvinyltransferase [Prevotella sp.]|nr:3-phosphoshikimate 1-carboxyvinyltransferase [Prevotella sp.]